MGMRGIGDGAETEQGLLNKFSNKCVTSENFVLSLRKRGDKLIILREA